MPVLPFLLTTFCMSLRAGSPSGSTRSSWPAGAMTAGGAKAAGRRRTWKYRSAPTLRPRRGGRRNADSGDPANFALIHSILPRCC